MRADGSFDEGPWMCLARLQPGRGRGLADTFITFSPTSNFQEKQTQTNFIKSFKEKKDSVLFERFDSLHISIITTTLHHFLR